MENQQQTILRTPKTGWYLLTITNKQNKINDSGQFAARGIQDDEVEAVLSFLKERWLGHIQSEDKKYAPSVPRNI
jgi:hypothetical protein